jgi:hypothetical protein
VRRVLLAVWLHSLLISKQTVMLAIGVYVIAATLGWCVIGIMIGLHWARS